MITCHKKTARRLLIAALLVGTSALAGDVPVTQNRTLDIRVKSITWRDSGDLAVVLSYRSSSGESQKREVLVAPSRAASDDDGTSLGNVAQGLLDDAASLKSRIETVVTAAVAGGKLAPR